jgi:hypothetical protein
MLYGVERVQKIPKKKQVRMQVQVIQMDRQQQVQQVQVKQLHLNLKQQIQHNHNLHKPQHQQHLPHLLLEIHRQQLQLHSNLSNLLKHSQPNLSKVGQNNN